MRSMSLSVFALTRSLIYLGQNIAQIIYTKTQIYGRAHHADFSFVDVWDTQSIKLIAHTQIVANKSQIIFSSIFIISK